MYSGHIQYVWAFSSLLLDGCINAPPCNSIALFSIIGMLNKNYAAQLIIIIMGFSIGDQNWPQHRLEIAGNYGELMATHKRLYCYNNPYYDFSITDWPIKKF